MISVIVCAYNEEKLVRQCLEALANQKLSKLSFEVIVIDDESSDKTPEICKKFIEQQKGDKPLFKYYRIQHGGLSIARNTGVSKSKGNIICFIDGDALAEPLWLNEYNKTFLNPDIHFSSGRINLLNTESLFANTLQHTRFVQQFTPPFNNHFHGVNMAFRREIFENLGGFFENFESRGDDTTFRNIVKEHYTYQPTPSAAVEHERPESFQEWFKIYLKELKFQYLVFKALRASKSGLSYTIPLLKSIFITLSIIAGFLWWPIFILAFLAFLVSKRKHLFIKKDMLPREWLFNLCYHTLDVLLRPIYFIKSYIVYRNAEIKSAYSNSPKILEKEFS